MNFPVTIFFVLFFHTHEILLEWNWIYGDSSSKVESVIHTFGTPHPKNTPGRHTGSSFYNVDDQFIFLLFGQKYNTYSSIIQLSQEVWRFNIVTEEWTFLKGEINSEVLSQHGFLASTGYNVSNLPGARAIQAGSNVIYRLDGDIELCTFGGLGHMTGYGESITILNEFLCYSVNYNMWKQPFFSDYFPPSFSSSKGEVGAFNPGGRMKSLMFLLNDTFYIFSGEMTLNPLKFKPMNDVWEYSLQRNEWKWVHGNNTFAATSYFEESGTFGPDNQPGSRTGMCGWKVGDDSFGIYGGNADITGGDPFIRMYSDVWFFNSTLLQWKHMFGSETISSQSPKIFSNDYLLENHPGSKQGCGCAVIGDEVFVVGGGISIEDSEMRNTVFVYSMSRNLWKKILGEFDFLERGIYDLFVESGTYSKYVVMGARNYMGVTKVGNNEIYVLGGLGVDEVVHEDDALNDIFVINTDIKQFKYVRGYKNKGKYSMYPGLAYNWDGPGIPGRRFSASSFKINENRIGLFGGYGSTPFEEDKYLNDLWVYYTEENQFYLISGSVSGNTKSIYGSYYEFSSSFVIGGRYGPIACALNNYTYLFFGGCGYETNVDSRILSSLFIFNAKTSELALFDGGEEYETLHVNFRNFGGNKPGSRCYNFGFLYDNKRYFVIFGGSSMLGNFNDIMIYDMEDKHWNWIDGDVNSIPIYSKNETASIGSRAGMVGWVIKDTFFIFGGIGKDSMGGFDPLNDLWRYNLTEYQWYFLKGSKEGSFLGSGFSKEFNDLNSPSARYHLSSFHFGNDDSFFIFGGIEMTCKDDLWEYNITLNMWRVVNVTRGSPINDSSFEVGSYGDKGVPDISNYPGCRTKQASFTSNGVGYFFGGEGSDLSVTFRKQNDIWSIQLTIVCFGYSYNDPQVCNGRGKCVEDSICVCEENYFGENCEISSCFGKLSNDSKVCSNNGYCIDFDECECIEGYGGFKCQNPKCFGVQSTETGVCNSFGSCVGVDKCACGWFRKAPACAAFEEYFIVSIIVFPLLLCLLVTILFIICFVLIICRRRISKFAKTIKAARTLDDIDLLLEEQEVQKDLSIAHLKINKKLFEIKESEVKLEKLIGEGGSMCRVYVAKWKGLKVAFKSFRGTSGIILTKSQRNFEEFEKEVGILASVSHPNILRFYGAILTAKRIGYLMEFAGEGELGVFIRKFSKKNGFKYPIENKIRLFLEVARGMSHLHSLKIIHRDLKPENVLIIEKTLTAKIMDFGISRILRDNDKTMTKRVGTSYFMAPEVFSGVKYDSKCDSFSFGMLMFVCLSEKFSPYGLGKTNVEIKVSTNPDYRPEIIENEFEGVNWIIDLIKRCWDHNAEKRPSFKEICQELEENRGDEVSDVKVVVVDKKREEILQSLKRRINELEKDNEHWKIQISIWKKKNEKVQKVENVRTLENIWKDEEGIKDINYGDIEDDEEKLDHEEEEIEGEEMNKHVVDIPVEENHDEEISIETYEDVEENEKKKNVFVHLQKSLKNQVEDK